MPGLYGSDSANQIDGASSYSNSVQNQAVANQEALMRNYQMMLAQDASQVTKMLLKAKATSPSE